MVYDWAPYEDECYRIFIEEGKSVAEVQKILRDKYGFEPSQRGYEVQFKRWGFPSKRGTPEEIAKITERIGQLWDINATRQEMLKVLEDEGYRVSEPQLRRLRQKNGWMYRSGPAYGRDDEHEPTPAEDDADTAAQPDTSRAGQLPPQDMSFLQNTYQHFPTALQSTTNAPYTFPPQPPTPTPSPHQNRANRLATLQARSDTLRTQKKRRRRIGTYGGLDPDPPGPPRFASETTIDESKAFLHLSNEIYLAVREHFVNVCGALGVIRKAGSAPGLWQAAKDRLVNENEHLQKEFYGPWDGVAKEQKGLALDAICMSVTKAMREAGKSMKLVDAKSALGLNPGEAKKVRAHFYGILSKDGFVSMVETGPEHWNELKRQWYEESPMLQQSLGVEPDALKKKAFDRLASDVMKRLRNDLIAKDPSLKGTRDSGPGPGPIYKGSLAKQNPQDLSNVSSVDGTMSLQTETSDNTPATLPDSTPYASPLGPHHHGCVALAAPPQSTTRSHGSVPKVAKAGGQKPTRKSATRNVESPQTPNPQPDPPPGSAQSHRSAQQQEQMDERRRQQEQQQLAASQLAAFSAQPVPQLTQVQAQPIQPPPQPQVAALQAQPQPTATNPIAALFRLSAASTIHSSKQMWFGMLSTRSLSEVINKTVNQFNDIEGRRVSVHRVEGILNDGAGGEAEFRIESDSELEAYLGWVEKGRCVFLVTVGSVIA